MTAALDRLNPEERSAAARYLTLTREKLLDAVHGLSDPQWRFQPSPDRWSIAGVVDHMVAIEELIQRILARMPQAPQAETGRNNAAIEQMILHDVPNRTEKLQAPPPTHPTGKCDPSERLAQMLESRTRLLQLLDAPALRGHLIPHPVFGPWDGYQWILAAGSHMARHTAQILEIRSHGDFPQP
jgi:DinB family protein